MSSVVIDGHHNTVAVAEYQNSIQISTVGIYTTAHFIDFYLISEEHEER